MATHRLIAPEWQTDPTDARREFVVVECDGTEVSATRDGQNLATCDRCGEPVTTTRQ